MRKRRTTVYIEKSNAVKIVEVIKGPEGVTRIYGNERKCQNCGCPLSKYNPTDKCALCRTIFEKKIVPK